MVLLFPSFENYGLLSPSPSPFSPFPSLVISPLCFYNHTWCPSAAQGQCGPLESAPLCGAAAQRRLRERPPAQRRVAVREGLCGQPAHRPHQRRGRTRVCGLLNSERGRDVNISNSSSLTPFRDENCMTFILLKFKMLSTQNTNILYGTEYDKNEMIVLSQLYDKLEVCFPQLFCVHFLFSMIFFFHLSIHLFNHLFYFILFCLFLCFGLNVLENS